MKSNPLLFLLPISLLHGLAQGALLVDFSDSATNVAPAAAGFIIASGSLGPQSAVFFADTQGYSSPPMDTGSGITVALAVYATSGTYTNSLRLQDRNDAVADLQSDWVFQGGTADGAVARVGLRLTLTGLKAGNYNFSSYHIDTDSMGGVMDAQYSINGGSSWNNTIYDNASFTGGLMMNLQNITVSEANGLQLRYLVGGNLFGTTGVARSGDMNFLLPHNSFSITAVPEPTMSLLVFSGIPALLIRRRVKLYGRVKSLSRAETFGGRK